jgi:hypothetical protein
MKSIAARSTYDLPSGTTKEINKLLSKDIEIIKEETIEIINRPLRKKSLDLAKP